MGGGRLGEGVAARKEPNSNSAGCTVHSKLTPSHCHEYFYDRKNGFCREKNFILDMFFLFYFA